GLRRTGFQIPVGKRSELHGPEIAAASRSQEGKYEALSVRRYSAELKRAGRGIETSCPTSAVGPHGSDFVQAGMLRHVHDICAVLAPDRIGAVAAEGEPGARVPLQVVDPNLAT